MNKAYLPADAQPIKTPMTGSDLALNDAARDYANMKAQPASVQWGVLAELRGTRLAVMQQYASLSNELKNLPLTPDNVQRRTELSNQLDHLEQRDTALLGAAKQQVLDMGAAGTANPLRQPENSEKLGDALGSARLSGKGISSANLKARADMLKGAIAEAKAASAAEKAIAQTKVENNIYRDGDNPQSWTPGKPGDPASNLVTHWTKHQAEFPDLKSLNDYYRATVDFVSSPPPGTLSKTTANGDVLLYNPVTNIFSVKTASGIPRTMFKPSPSEHGFATNMDFWNSK